MESCSSRPDRRRGAILVVAPAVSFFLASALAAQAPDLDWLRRFGSTPADKVTAVDSRVDSSIDGFGDPTEALPGQVVLADSDVSFRKAKEPGAESWARQSSTPEPRGKKRGVGIIVYCHGGGEVMVLLADHAWNERGYASFGGLLDGEPGEEAALRELREETRCGYDLDLSDLSGPSFDVGGSRNWIQQVSCLDAQRFAWQNAPPNCRGEEENKPPSVFEERSGHRWVPLPTLLRAIDAAESDDSVEVEPEGIRLWNFFVRVLRSARRKNLLPGNRLPAPPQEGQAESGREDIEAALSQVEAWRAAWSQQRVDDYLAFYAREFRPQNSLDRSAWQAQRRQRLEAPAFIRVTISELRAEPVEGGTVRVTFRQRYESDRFGDTVTKVLTLIEDDGAWRILSERVIGG